MQTLEHSCPEDVGHPCLYHCPSHGHSWGQCQVEDSLVKCQFFPQHDDC